MEEVAYLYTETREGDFLQELLLDFKGVLVSDFYAAYDAINCAQQKCLIHLMRDLNNDLLKLGCLKVATEAQFCCPGFGPR
jgi:Transposase IS66 family